MKPDITRVWPSSNPKPMNEEIKTCIKCSRKLKTSKFNKSKINQDGYSAYCKDCVNKIPVLIKDNELD